MNLQSVGASMEIGYFRMRTLLNEKIHPIIEVMNLKMEANSIPPGAMWVTVAVASIGFLFIMRRIIFGRPLRLPPGPVNLPVIGAMLSMGTELHTLFAKMADKYGPLIYLRLGVLPVVVVSSAELAEELMREKDAEFASRAHSGILYSNATYFGFGASNMGFAPNTPTLRQTRKICTTELLCASKINNSYQIRFEEQGELLKEIRELTKDGGEFKLREVLHTMTMNTTCRILFGKRYYGKNIPVTKDLEDFKSLMIEMVDTAGKLNITDLLPYLRWLDPQGLTAEFKRLHAKQRRILSQLLEDHRLARDMSGVQKEEDKKDFVDILLSQEGENKLADKNIMATTSDMLIGASDTTATTVEWAMIELLRKPEVMAKMQQELDEVVGKRRAVEEMDLPKLPYLEAVVKEVLRMYPPLTLLIPRMNESKTTLGSYDIPKGSSIFVNVYKIGRDPSLWEKPDQFIPERFLNSSMHYIGNNYQYLPFGAGRRKCVGINLGQLLVQRTLACLVHSFDLLPPKGKTHLDISNADEYGMVLRSKHPLFLRAASRLPTMEVYYACH